jgi:thiol-disulfide isomerase/thioredoxin
MNKKIITTIAIIATISVGAALLILKNGNKTIEAQSNQVVTSQNNGKQSADKVQVYLFHATQRCPTCIAIGRLSGETVNEFFQPELKSGKIEFREINIDSPENKDLAKKFQASGSALYINSIVGGKDNISQDTAVWRLTSDEAKFKSHLKDELNKQFNK